MSFRLHRNAMGRLVFTRVDGETHEGVVPVRAFPVAAPEEGLALVSPDGHELAWIERVDQLPAEMRKLVDEEIEARDFMPEIRHIVRVSSFATPSTWEVDTDLGATSFVLRGEEDIRRLIGPSFVIADSHGVQFYIRDVDALDRHSRRILDRFL